MNSDQFEEKQRLAEAVVKSMFELDKTAHAMGIMINDVRPGYVQASMTVREDMLNFHGTCHGGMIFVLADAVFGYACNSENRATVALSCTINYAQAANLGDELTATGQRNFRNSRTGVYDIDVTRKDGTVVCTFRGGSYQVKGESFPGLNERLGIVAG